jgi:hypothetical protein
MTVGYLMVEKERFETQFLLPFSVLSENRKEPFTKEVERATIFCLTELERAKEGGLILKHSTEKLDFIAEFCYPFWLIPWSRLNLLFDGLNRVTNTFAYKTIPETMAFMEKLERSSKTFEVYMAFLSDNINYFQTPTAEKAIVINGLIRDPNLLNEFALYFSEARQIETPSPNLTMLSPKIDESAILSMADELENLESRFKEDVEMLSKSMKLLNKTTNNFRKTALGKIKIAREEFNREIEKQESIMKPQLDLVNDEYDKQITRLTKDFENILLPLQKEKVKLEKTKEQAIYKIEQYKTEAKTNATRKDVVGERKWKEKVNETKQELSEIEAKIKEANEKIKSAEENRSLEVFKQKSEWEAKIKEVKKDLLELEASRDVKIQIHEQELDKLEKLTSTITEQIDKIAKLREANLFQLDQLGIEQKQGKISLVYVPFYLACYQSNSRKRYVMFPPSVANSISFAAKLKGALGKAKVKQLLTPRFKSIATLLYRLPAFIEDNAVIERELNEDGSRTDLLKTNVIQEQIRNGMRQLKEEGWLSEKEFEAFTKA